MKKDLLARLACPACLGKLKHQATEFLCDACKLAYPIESGIPMLLKDCAKPVTQPTTPDVEK